TNEMTEAQIAVAIELPGIIYVEERPLPHREGELAIYGGEQVVFHSIEALGVIVPRVAIGGGETDFLTKRDVQGGFPVVTLSPGLVEAAQLAELEGHRGIILRCLCNLPARTKRDSGSNGKVAIEVRVEGHRNCPVNV